MPLLAHQALSRSCATLQSQEEASAHNSIQLLRSAPRPAAFSHAQRMWEVKSLTLPHFSVAVAPADYSVAVQPDPAYYSSIDPHGREGLVLVAQNGFYGPILYYPEGAYGGCGREGDTQHIPALAE